MSMEVHTGKNDDGRDAGATAADHRPPSPEEENRNVRDGDPKAPASPPSLELPAVARVNAFDPKKVVAVGKGKQKPGTGTHVGKVAAGRPPLSPTTTAAVQQGRNLLRSLG